MKQNNHIPTGSFIELRKFALRPFVFQALGGDFRIQVDELGDQALILRVTSDQRMVGPAVFIHSLEEPDVTIAELIPAIDLFQQQFRPRQTGFLKPHHQCSDCACVFS